MTENFWEIFISHGTKGTNGVASRVLQRLYEQYDGNGYLVHVDRMEIHEGVHWKPWIRRTLYRSHVVIALLDDRAIGREWVRYEVAMGQSDFFHEKFVPILIGIGLSDRKLAAFMRLTDIQAITADEPEQARDADEEADRVVKLIGERLPRPVGGLRGEDLPLIRRLAQSFDGLTQRDAARRIAEHFPGEAQWDRRMPFFQDELLAQLILADQLGDAALDALRFVPVRPAYVNEVRPIILSSWLSWPEVQALRTDGEVPRERALVAVLQSDDIAIAEQYAVRAQHCRATWRSLIPLAMESDGEPHPPSHWVDQVLGQDHLACGATGEGTCVHSPVAPKHVIVQPDGPLAGSVEVVHEIHRRCPWIVVVLLIRPDDYRKLGEDGVRALLGGDYRAVPPVDDERASRFTRGRKEITYALTRGYATS